MLCRNSVTSDGEADITKFPSLLFPRNKALISLPFSLISGFEKNGQSGGSVSHSRRRRTQAWLIKQQGPDGTWANIGATHGESIERMGNPRLLLTSYVVWSLADSGFKGKELQKSIDFIRAEVKKADNPYILALAANALAAWDANDDSTLEVLKKLATMKKELPEQKALCFPVANGQSLSYSRGDSLTV